MGSLPAATITLLPHLQNHLLQFKHSFQPNSLKFKMMTQHQQITEKIKNGYGWSLENTITTLQIRLFRGERCIQKRKRYSLHLYMPRLFANECNGHALSSLFCFHYSLPVQANEHPILSYSNHS